MGKEAKPLLKPQKQKGENNMSNLIMVNAKKYSSSSELDHNSRSQKEPEHLLKQEDRFENYLDKDSKKKFNELKKEASNRMKKKRTNWKKSSLPNVDMVIGLGEEQTLKIIEELGIEKANIEIAKRMEQLGKRIEEELGITFVSFNIHNDEGHYKDGAVKYNFHTHLNFLDFNFKTNKMVMSNEWRPHTTKSKKKFSELQTIAGEIFKDLGFERGIENSKKEAMDISTFKKVKQLEDEFQDLTLEQLEEKKVEYKNDKLKKRFIDYAYRAKKLEHKEYEVEEMKKQYDRLLTTWEKIQNDSEITENEQKEFTKMLKAVGAKAKAKSVSNMKTISKKKMP